MNQTWNSFFQTVFQFVKALFTNASKKMHRDAVVLTVGISVVTMVTFTAGDLRGGGRNALVAFAETQEKDEREADLEEIDVILEGTDAIALAAEEKSGQKEETDSMSLSGSREDGEQENGNTEGTKSTNESETVTVSEEEEAGEDVLKDALQEGRASAEGTDPEDAGKEEAVLEEGSHGQDETSGAAKEAANTKFSLSDRDYRVLLKIVQAEAGNCDKKGRILVANVILNRVKSDRFPDTITGVVYQRNQFSPVNDGSIDRCRVSKETVEAVKCALSGEDYSAGALYFMNRRTSSGKNVRWFDNHLNYLFKHGSHEFFK